MSHNTWVQDKDITSTTWGVDWDTYSAADHVVIALDFNPCCIQETLIVTISPF